MEELKRFRCFKALPFAVLLCWFPTGCSITPQPANTTLVERYPFFPHPEVEEKRIRKMVDDINAMDLPWKAEYNPLASLEGATESEKSMHPRSAERDMREVIEKEMEQDTEAHLRELRGLNIDLPESFDAREKWTRCASIHKVQNQGGCGSCWAAATVGMLSDRLCISSNYTNQEMISLQDLVSCCDYCGTCSGGFAERALFYWKNSGIVTGGAFGSSEGCKPYEVGTNCGVPCPGYFHTDAFTPRCEKKCSVYGKDYQSELSKGKSFYALKNFGEKVDNDVIKREIITHGPVVCAAHVSEPFAHYRSGIYTATPIEGHRNLNYGHVMRIVGWGRENGEEYWTIANSWGAEWGQNGFGRLSVKYPLWDVHGGL